MKHRGVTYSRSVEGYFQRLLGVLEDSDLRLYRDDGRVFLEDGKSGASVSVGKVDAFSVRGGVLYGMRSDRWRAYAYISPTFLFQRLSRAIDVLSERDDVLRGLVMPDRFSARISYDLWFNEASVRDLVDEEVWGLYALSVEGVVLSAPERGLYVFGLG